VTEPRRFGDILLEWGLVSPAHLQDAVATQARTGKRLGEILLRMGAVTEEQLNWALSERLRVPLVDLDDDVVDFDLIRSMPEELLRRLEAAPVLRVGEEMTVIVADPTNQQAAVELASFTGTRVSTAMAARDRVLHLLDKAFPAAVPTDAGAAQTEDTRSGAGSDHLGIEALYSLLLGALRESATEIHVEPRPREAVVRQRVGGQLVEAMRLPLDRLASLVFRFRVLAGARADGLPQQAHVQTRLEGKDVELELFFFPTLHGDAVTVRIRPRSLEAPTLDSLNLPSGTRATLAALVSAPGGLVVVAGWEPRARATLLYALARAASSEARRTLTIERTVSFIVPDFLQVEVPGDFPAGAATTLGQPADVILVEDLATSQVCAAAFGSVEQGALVVGGLGVATNQGALAHLLTLDVPRAPFLAITRGVAHVRRRGEQYQVEPLPLPDSLRTALLAGKDPWTSPSS
jgi:type IV pilus assembly protein PilB